MKRNRGAVVEGYIYSVVLPAIAPSMDSEYTGTCNE